MKIIPLANLHGYLPTDKELPPGDVMVIAGGVLPYGKNESHLDNMAYQSIFMETSLYPWLEHQSTRYGLVMMTWGFSDLLPYAECINTVPEAFKADYSPLPDNVLIKVDEVVTYRQKNFYLTPWSNENSQYAFNTTSFDEEHVWNNIPHNTDVLISHESPLNIFSNRLGSNSLAKKVDKTSNIKAHIFGHFHAAGKLVRSDRTYVNASFTHLNKNNFVVKDTRQVMSVEI